MGVLEAMNTRVIWDEGWDMQPKGGWAEDGKEREPSTMLHWRLDPKPVPKTTKPSPSLHRTDLKVLLRWSS